MYILYIPLTIPTPYPLPPYPSAEAAEAAAERLDEKQAQCDSLASCVEELQEELELERMK
jgi:hypothetical protein